MTGEKARPRILVLVGLVAFMFAVITARLWFLQVLASQEYAVRSETNRVRVAPDPAGRGRIYDRDGELLVGNRASFAITVDRREVPDEEKLLAELASVLDVPVERLAERLTDPDFLPYEPVPVHEDARLKDIFIIEEQFQRFPGVEVKPIGVRDYPHGKLGPHLLGYLGQITKEELGRFPKSAGYRGGQLVGRGGVEETFELSLRGKDGQVKYQVDASGKVLKRLASVPSEPGYDVQLTVDRRIQEVAQTALKEGAEAARGIYHEGSGTYLKAPAGAVVVMDPANGGIVAMASWPTYDPRTFLGGLTDREWDRLNDPDRNYPLNNRAIQASYPPGSTFKPFIAAAALKAGHADLTSYYDCPPEWAVPTDPDNPFSNWTDAHLGFISLSHALVQSCDTVFYQLGYEFYRDRDARGEQMQSLARLWGFGKDTGIDIPYEANGRIPDADWKARIHELYPDLFPYGIWLPGDDINFSIGQGDVLTTPLQVASAYSALANGGTLYRPHVGLRVKRADGRVIRRVANEVIREVPFKRAWLREITNALVGVVRSGTAAKAFTGFPHDTVPVAGKTGTSEVEGKQPHSWFAAYAPAHEPRYVVVAIVEEGGHGSEVAAPIVRRVLEGIFQLESGGLVLGDPQD
ncbi:MAG: penicillin-binding protein 2 [Actinomycetota bacterium]|nr:penicillin-binding protein 2 [Actinomycetota bacterium]